jgi:hypothetical protein
MTVGITELPPEGMQLGGVALAGDADRGTKTTEGLSLLFTTAGITVQGPQPQIERLLVWSGLDSASCREKIALPDGRNAAVMELTSGGQSIRFLLPMDTVTPGQAAYLDQALPAWLVRYKGTSAAPSMPPMTTPPAAPPPPPPATGGPTAPAGQPSPDAQAGPPPATAPGVAAAGVAGASAGNGTAGGTATPSSGSASTSGPPASAPFTPPSGSSPDPGPTAPAPDLAPPPPFVARSNPESPPRGGPASDVPPSAAFPPPPPPVAPAANQASNGWALSTDPMPDDAAWASPPLAGAATAGTTQPAKKPRSWRKGKSTAPAGAAAGAAAVQSDLAPAPDLGAPTTAAPASAFAPMEPPAQAPVDPVPLKVDRPLPPPPSDEVAAASAARGPVLWKPPIDPATGEPVWDQSTDTATKSPKKPRGWRKGAAAGAAGTGAALAADPDAPQIAPSPGASGNGAQTLATPDREFDDPAKVGAPPTRKNNGAVLAVLIVVLVVVIGGIAYVAVRKNNTTTPTTGAPATTPAQSAAANATALAVSLNLRQSDLPSGWTRIQPAVVAPAGAQAAAQTAAQRNLSSCLGQPFAVVAGLFGGAALPGASGAADSPTFQEGSDSSVRMASTSSVQTTVTDNQVLTGPFANPKFLSCYGQYQTALASALVPGSTAVVQAVALPVSPGVTTYAYLTTSTSPSKATSVAGEAFIFGGRDLTRLSPTTDGPPVPQGPFAQAYDSITARVAKAIHQ